MSNPFRRSLAAVTVAGLAGAASFAGASPAQSVPADPACPEAFPVAALVKGQPVDGLTVSSGTVPDTFGGEVLGVLRDGIAPGLDMIIVRLTSTEIDRVGGIWAGMSGSPVYAADGRLIGAVSYGLAWGSSPVAGVTPAADMKELLAQSPEAALAQPAQKVALSSTMRARMVASGDATAAEAESGLQRLPVPVAVSGMYNSARLNRLAKKFQFDNVKFYRSGAAPAAPAVVPEDEIFAGSNLAASLSYGAFSAVGTGTATMVCDGNVVVGFGHPFGFAGDTSLTLHGADAIYIQEDPLGVPFKVANPTEPVGVIDQDRLAGIKGLIGIDSIPENALIHAVVTGPTGKQRTGDTHVSLPDFTAFATAFGNLSILDRTFDHIGKGSSLVHFTIDGTTAAGEPFTVVRTNRYADTFDIAFPSIFEAADSVFALVDNEFTDVDIDQVSIATTLSTQPRRFKVAKVQVRRHGIYRTLTSTSRIRARAGRNLNFRVFLESPKDKWGTKVVTTSVRVPADTQVGSFGSVSLGTAFSGDEFEEFRGFDDESGPASFDELVDSIESAPRNDELTTDLEFFAEEFGTSSSTVTEKLVSDVITNSRSFEVRVVS